MKTGKMTGEELEKLVNEMQEEFQAGKIASWKAR